MKPKISEKDLEIIRKLFISETSDVDIVDTKNFFEIGQLKMSKLGKNAETRSLILSADVDLPKDGLEYQTVLHFGYSKEQILKHKFDFRFIRINGAIRWIYPSGQMNSIFDFYHASTARARLIKFGLKLISKCRLDALISKRIDIHSNTPNCLQVATQGIPFDTFSVFTGTPGIERTALVAFLTGNKSTHFLKLGLNSISKSNVGNEGNILHKLNRESLEQTVVPLVNSTNTPGVIAVSKLMAKSKKVTNSFLKQHANTLIELSNLCLSHQRFDESTFGESIIDNCSFIRSGEEQNSPIATLLMECFDDVPNDYHFTAGLVHGDFTPWNMFLAEDKLFLYDWEASMRFAPSLFDLFHFHFQTGIYLKNWSFNEVYAQIKFSIETHSCLQNKIKVHSIDVKRHLQLYLLYTISRQLALKSLSPDEVIISEGKLSVWKDALIFVLPETVDQRVGFISEFEIFLSGVQHAFLKFDAQSLSMLPVKSDLDIAVHKDGLDQTLNFCRSHNYVKRYKSVNKSFMTTLQLFFKDGRYLSIDLIHDFRRKWVRFMDINDLLHYTSKNEMGLSVPALQHDIEYTLMFYSLNGAKVPTKYIEFFKNTKREDQMRTLRYFQEKYDLNYYTIEELLNAHDINRSYFQESLKKQSRHALIPNVKSKLNYVTDTIKERVGRRGFMLTFSGVDGVGKTTVIDLVKEQLQEKYRKEVVLMRHRPKVLPILSAFKYGSVSQAENKSTHLSPNTTTKKSVIGSYLRFFYYYLDYLIGQFYVHARYVWGGKIVLYDRYYFDLINHPERTNLVVNQKFAKWLYRPILKPDLNIFLNASAEEIVLRKQELDSKEITMLSGKYLSLFGELSRKSGNSRYVVHRNDNLSATVAEILQDIQQIA